MMVVAFALALVLAWTLKFSALTAASVYRATLSRELRRSALGRAWTISRLAVASREKVSPRDGDVSATDLW
jgi:hypothetical protein